MAVDCSCHGIWGHGGLGCQRARGGRKSRAGVQENSTLPPSGGAGLLDAESDCVGSGCFTTRKEAVWDGGLEKNWGLDGGVPTGCQPGIYLSELLKAQPLRSS